MKLIVAEKPSAAERIAKSVSPSRVKEKKWGKVRYYEFDENGSKVVVVPCAGHLFGLATDREGYPVLFARYEPMFETDDEADYTKEYIDLISNIGEDAEEFVAAADYDTEGSVIAYNALRFCLSSEVPKQAKRMKFSSLTMSELRRAYRNLSEELDWGMVHAGLARAYMDFIWGLTTSRALTESLKKADEYGTLSAGRVQTPTLDMLAEREREIQDFEPEPYWIVEISIEVNDKEFSVTTDKIWEKDKANKLTKRYRGRKALVTSFEEEVRNRYPPHPFNLSDLQSEGSSKLGYSPAKIQSIAQDLYDRALISYPRTSSQKLPPGLNTKKIIEKLKKNSTLKSAAERVLSLDKLEPNEGSKEDPAHPCIYPTRTPNEELSEEMWNVYELISRRFLATFGRPAKIMSQKIGLSIGNHEFEANGRYYTDNGWLEIYDRFSSKNEEPLPKLEAGDKVNPEKVETLERKTKPPRRYTKSSIIKEMEKKEIGTKATRAPIVEKLKDRDYIRGKRKLEVTKLGLAVSKSLKNHVPELTSENLTREFEAKMDEIRNGDKRHSKVVNKARNKLKTISKEFEKNEKEIGETLAKAKKEVEKKMKEEKSLGDCPECGEGQILVKKTEDGNKFAGCDQYPDCKNSYSVPQKHFRILKSTCDDCGLRLLSLKGEYGRFHLCIKCGPTD